MGEKWTAGDMPDQSGRIAVVTGSNSGLGLVTALELARKGATVVVACRNQAKGRAAIEQIQREVPEARLELSELDLSSQSSVKEFAARFVDAHDGLDLLINNAGVMAPPLTRTADGWEQQIGTNHLGHFTLTAKLIGAMEGRDDARVVTLSSGAHRIGKIRLDDLNWNSGRYSRWLAYGQSKLANLQFALELHRRLEAAGSPIKSLAAHPGYAATNLQTAAAPFLDRMVMKVTNTVLAQSAEMGALPQLYAATSPEARSGCFIGPDGFQAQRGYPHVETPSGAARDEEVARRLWELSEELTGVRFELGARATA
jgi:NAD(P)-dependent dehydrogenase (short-subunit alcohol dehydrogenase family)